MTDAIILICSTPNSKRLPEKCFKLINGKSVLEHIFDRTKGDIECVLLIPDNISNEHYRQYWSITGKYNIKFHQGNEYSPLHRMADYLNKKYLHQEYPKYVVRITHDDIFIDATTMLQMIDYADKKKIDYLYCPSILEGAGVEVISTANIIVAAEKYKFPIEHISYFVKFGKIDKFVPRETIRRNYRLTLDYPADAILAETILRSLGNDCSVDEICSYLMRKPPLLDYNKSPDITVYTCVKNGAEWIHETIKSISIAMSLSELYCEYILIDDGSTDETLERAIWTISVLQMKNVEVIVNDKNIGLASSSNIAISKAKGKYVIRVDADDMLCPHSLRKMYDKIEETEAIVIYPDYFEWRQKEYVLNKIDGKVNHHAGCALMNKKAINELRFKEGLRHWDSKELYRRIRYKTYTLISYIHEALFYYRKHDMNMSKPSKEREKVLEEIENG